MLNEEMDGYKAFNIDFTNCVGDVCGEDTIINYDGNIEFRKSGIHFCKRLEDVFKYYNGLKNDIIICRVKAIGNVSWFDDYDYFYGDYDDIGVCNSLYIGNVMSRDEIFNYACSLDSFRLMRFIRGYRMNSREIECLKDIVSSSDVIDCIKYYQEGNSLVYSRKK